jgi:uncharacterized membrane protein
MIQAGMYEADGKTLKPKMKTAFTHAAMNDVMVALAAYSWFVRRDRTGGMIPTGLNVLVAAVSLPGLMFSANLGGTLVYNYGVGLQAGKKGKAS